MEINVSGDLVNTIILKGRVLPEVRNVSIPNLGKILSKDPKGIEGELEIEIENGAVRATWKLATQPENYYGLCISKTYEIVRMFIDVFAFSKGWSLFLIFDSVIDKGVRAPIVLGEVSVQKHTHSLAKPDEFRRVCELAMKNFDLRFAFNDLATSLTTQNYSAIAAARAAEVIRNVLNTMCQRRRSLEKYENQA